MYKFTYQTRALDFWQLSMYYTYGSVVGVCNIIFTVAMFILAVTMWGIANPAFRVSMVLGCCLFTVIQPVAVWNKAAKMAKGILCDTEIDFNDKGVHISANNQNADIKWSNIKKVAKKPTMVIIYSDTVHGYVLSNKVLGNRKQEFYKYVMSKINKK